MAYSPEVRQAVRTTYLKGLPLKAAAEANSVPYETARSWKRKAELAGDNWDNARAATRLSQGSVQELTASIIEDFVHLFQSTMDEVKHAEGLKPLQKAEVISRLSDAYTKTVKAAGDSSPELSRLSVAMDVLKLQADFIRTNYPQHLDAFMELLGPFGEVVSREYKT